MGMQSIENSFNVYPNPGSSIINISAPQQTRFSIVDTEGEAIFTETISTVVSIDISKLSNGIYYVKDHQTGKTIKFIKE